MRRTVSTSSTLLYTSTDLCNTDSPKQGPQDACILNQTYIHEGYHSTTMLVDEKPQTSAASHIMRPRGMRIWSERPIRLVNEHSSCRCTSG